MATTKFSLFFLWLGLVHLTGLYFFTQGFLLTRQILESRSTCDEPPREIWASTAPHADDGCCWLRPTFKKAIILIIDALRYDFTTPIPPSQADKPYHNALTVLHTLAHERPRNALLLPFLADPPTTTLQRLKALTTGTLPTFIEAGSNFAGSALTEDNLIDQLLLSCPAPSLKASSNPSANSSFPHPPPQRRLVHLGDDTWLKLYPAHFLPHLSHPFSSFVVEDLHTVDTGVTTHLLPLLRNDTLQHEWDVIVGHFLGVDHVGHRFGAAHPLMRAKLRQIDAVVREVVAALDEDTVLVVMGDHGMDEHGNHGGETLEEVLAALWLYSPREFVGGRDAGTADVGNVDWEWERGGKEDLLSAAVPQVDIVSTLALLLGVPIPFNNLGRPIEEVFAFSTDGMETIDWGRLVRVNALAAAQMERFHAEYTRLYGGMKGGIEVWIADFVQSEVDFGDDDSLRRAYAGLREYQAELLTGYRRVWAQFNVLYMVEGVMVLLLSVLAMVCALIDGSCFEGPWFISRAAVAGGLMGVEVAGAHVVYADSAYRLVESLVLGTVIASLTSVIARVHCGAVRRCWQSGFSIANWQAILFPLALSLGFASNSYTIWEDEILLFFLSSFGLCMLVSSTHKISPVLFLLLTRLASFSRLCREEQLPTCQTTFYRLENYLPWRVVAPFLTAVLILSTLQAVSLRSIQAWFTLCIPAALVLNALFWTLETATEQNWLASIATDDTSKTLRVIIARIVLSISLSGLGSAFLSSKRFLNDKPDILTTAVLLVCILVSPPTSGLLLAALYSQLLLLPYSTTTHRSGPIVTALLGTFYFFTTGHNATFASIRWKAAHIGFRDVVYPWSPLLVGINTFAGPILAACAVPLFYRVSTPRERRLEVQAQMILAHSTVYALWAVSTAVWACILRRHLMLFAIFCPRFLMAAVVLGVVDVVGLVNVLVM
ncbi:GPI ethanolamine phosphate transferase 3 [Aspergillus homomorphus CBS 101889]|uniref:Alkaline phosphatase-like protein n=1 Tax=Aspergillus homomorphus (strain CBS 101889) TaxID=1450537 RepID=A0A395IBD0_ASPHC|nr:alkaline phosphatase-like protein [Aspergillus homomorphus CBS 101889]RAL17507.1 alkaline phosphatase-like protein [Aspergillus homomorphus CBS 101889]